MDVEGVIANGFSDIEDFFWARSTAMQALRRAAMTWGAEPVRIFEASSANVASRTQCSRFSMPQ